MTCETPPPAACEDANTLRTAASVGSCVDGTCIYASHDEPCAFGCSEDACAPDPCLGLTCTTAPDDSCDDAEHLHVYDTTGSCSAGECTYASRVLSCDCADDACTTDPCPNVTCNTPPGAVCPDDTTRRTFASVGTCSGGRCSYEPTDTPCEFGCSNGACNPDPCAGVQCTMPPAASCPTKSSRRTYRSPGTCDDGLCSYAATVTNCANDEECTGGVCVDNGEMDPVVPTVTGECPEFRTARSPSWAWAASRCQAGAKAAGPTAPMVFYWHGTGSFAGEYAGWPHRCTQACVEEGGVLISFQGTTGGDLLSGTYDLRCRRLRADRSARRVRRARPQRRSAPHLHDRLQRGRPVRGGHGDASARATSRPRRRTPAAGPSRCSSRTTGRPR